MSIKHNNYFKVHLPRKNYDGEDENDLTEIIMEEFYMISNGEMNKSYESVNPKEDKFEISVFPSIVYAANKLKKTDSEKFQMINNHIDNLFVDFLERFNPLYKCVGFIEYHLHFYKGNKDDFYKHIKYEILSIIRKRKNSDSKVDLENLEQIVNDWLLSKMKNPNTNINNAKNVIINNGNKNKTEFKETNFPEKNKKDKIGFYSLIAGIIGIIISIIIGWNEIIEFFNR